MADYEGAPETRFALELLALTFVRPDELRAAEWIEFDLDAAVWEIPAGRMKMRKPHRVPLTPRAVAILNDLRKLTGQGRFLFPSVRSLARCMSENTLTRPHLLGVIVEANALKSLGRESKGRHYRG
jgi:integrase